MTTLFYSYLILALFSTLGFGFLLNKLVSTPSDTNNLGIVGIKGLFFLMVISSASHFFVTHNYLHNLVLLLFGIFFFMFFFFRKEKKKKYLFYLIGIFLLLLIGFILAKNNEDFPYYHLPNSIQFFQQKIQFGLGNVNHGFKHISSIFLLNSIFIYPKINFYLINIPNFFLLIFSTYYFIYEIFLKNNLPPIKIYSLFSLILLLTKFSRLAEYGTDLFGQILIMIVVLETLKIIFEKKFIFDKIKYDFLLISLLLVFAITTKVYFLLYIILPLTIFFFISKKVDLVKFFFKPTNLFFLSIPLIFLISFNFVATGCFIYPAVWSCFGEKFSWALDIETVTYMNSHYELWAKGGRGVNYIVDDSKNYVLSFNWVPFWIKNYFFTKVTDFFLVIILISLVIYYFLFDNKNNNKKRLNTIIKKRLKLFFVANLFLLFIWFIQFPQLRYGGFVLVFLLFSIPLSSLFSEINLNKKRIKNKIILIVTISFFVFNLKNLIRINNEVNNVHLDNFKSFPLFYLKKVKFELIKKNNHDLYLTNGMCWATPSTCVRDTKINISTKNGYIFYNR